jgi:hypothetical protein
MKGNIPLIIVLLSLVTTHHFIYQLLKKISICLSGLYGE